MKHLVGNPFSPYLYVLGFHSSLKYMGTKRSKCNG